MDYELYRRASPIFQAVVDLPASEREAHLRRACGDDAALFEVVSRLVREDAGGASKTWEMFVELSAPSGPGGGGSGAVVNAGDVFGAYEAQRRLGVGGMAEIWAVRHRVLNTLHALKVLVWTSKPLRERMLREGRTQARLVHPHIQPVRDVLEVRGSPALLMPLVDGPSLATLIEGRSLGRAEALALFGAVLQGVRYAHEAAVVHRDLKPANVLLSVRPERVVPLVADFGLVKERDSVALTQAHAAMGTPAYAPPEQLSDAAAADERSDLFSLGVMFVELLTGERPFRGSTLAEIARAHRRPPELDGVPADLLPLVESLLASDPAARPPSCAAVAARLGAGSPEALAAGSPLYAAANALRSPILATIVAPFATDASSDPAPAARAPEHNLPHPRDAFVGRTDEIDALGDLLRPDRSAPRLVTLIGPGGAGKTRLGLQVAREDRGHWPGGVWWVDLSEARDEDGVLTAFARALDVPLGAQPHDQLSYALAARGRCLVVFDNVEQVSDHARALGRWLDRAPEAVFVATSRQPLRLRGEQLFPVAPLPLPQAVSLFEARARAIDPDFPSDAEARPDIERLVSLLDGLPLAIELAAAKIRFFAPAQLVDRLTRRFDLRIDRSPDRPARHLSLRATLQWSWELLDPVEQAALAQLSAFEGGFCVEAAEAVLQLPDDAAWVDEVLAELVDKSLVRQGPRGSARLSLLVSVAAFARDQLSSAGGTASAFERHGRWFAAMGQPASVGRQGGRTTDPAELDNLVVATRRALARGDADTAVPCALAAAEIFARVGPTAAGVSLLDEVRSGPALSHAQRADVLYRRGALSHQAIDLDQAHEAAAEALRSARLDGDRERTSDALRLLGAILVFDRRHPEAEPLIEEALALARSAGLRRAEGLALSVLGSLRAATGRLADAFTLHDQARAIAAALGFRREEGSSLVRAALVLAWLERWPEAEDHLHKALAIAEAIGDLQLEGYARTNLAQRLALDGRHDASRDHLTAALQIQRRLGHRRMEGRVLMSLGMADLARRQRSSAAGYLDEALAIADALDDRHLKASVLLHRATLDRTEDRNDAAIASLEAAAALYQGLGLDRQEGMARAQIGDLHRIEGRLDRARGVLRTRTRPLLRRRIPRRPSPVPRRARRHRLRRRRSPDRPPAPPPGRRHVRRNRPRRRPHPPVPRRGPHHPRRPRRRCRRPFHRRGTPRRHKRRHRDPPRRLSRAVAPLTGSLMMPSCAGRAASRGGRE